MYEELFLNIKENIKKIFITKFFKFILINSFLLFFSILLFYFKSSFNINFLILLYLFIFYIFNLNFTAYITAFIEKSEYDRIDISIILSNLNKSNEIVICTIARYIIIVVCFFLMDKLLRLIKFNLIDKNFFYLLGETINYAKKGDLLPLIYLIIFVIFTILFPLISVFFNFCNFYIIDKDEIAKNALSFSFSKIYKNYRKILLLNLPFYIIIYAMIFIGVYLVYILRETKILIILYFLFFSFLTVALIHFKTLINFNIYKILKNT